MNKISSQEKNIFKGIVKGWRFKKIEIIGLYITKNAKQIHNNNNKIHHLVSYNYYSITTVKKIDYSDWSFCLFWTNSGGLTISLGSTLGNLVWLKVLTNTWALSFSFLLINTVSNFCNWGKRPIMYNLKLGIKSKGFPWTVKDFKVLIGWIFLNSFKSWI